MEHTKILNEILYGFIGSFRMFKEVMTGFLRRYISFSLHKIIELNDSNNPPLAALCAACNPTLPT
jgi:hypothetical protein